MLHNSENGVFM